jgi:hypothetical protein
MIKVTLKNLKATLNNGINWEHLLLVAIATIFGGALVTGGYL